MSILSTRNQVRKWVSLSRAATRISFFGPNRKDPVSAHRSTGHKPNVSRNVKDPPKEPKLLIVWTQPRDPPMCAYDRIHHAFSVHDREVPILLFLNRSTIWVNRMKF